MGGCGMVVGWLWVVGMKLAGSSLRKTASIGLVLGRVDSTSNFGIK